VFSKADYELAARILGLPVPQTPAEMAAATPATAQIIRQFGQAAPPMPGMEGEGFYTGATRSLNAYPNNTAPMQKAQLAARLRTEPERPQEDAYLIELLQSLEPDEYQIILALIEQLSGQAEEESDRLSSQRPMEYDTPNLGSNYSVLNAPSSNGIEPSRAFQPLS
jgi:hypothetical protein